MPPGREEAIELLKDGTARVIFGGQTWTLRRPKTGEYKELSRRRSEMGEGLVRLGAERSEVVAQFTGTDVKPAARVKAEKRLGEIDGEQEALVRGYVAGVFEMLGDHKLPDEHDEWPVWTWASDGDDTMRDALFKHWRSLPLVRIGG